MHVKHIDVLSQPSEIRLAYNDLEKVFSNYHQWSDFSILFLKLINIYLC